MRKKSSQDIFWSRIIHLKPKRNIPISQLYERDGYMILGLNFERLSKNRQKRQLEEQELHNLIKYINYHLLPSWSLMNITINSNRIWIEFGYPKNELSKWSKCLIEANKYLEMKQAKLQEYNYSL